MWTLETHLIEAPILISQNTEIKSFFFHFCEILELVKSHYNPTQPTEYSEQNLCRKSVLSRKQNSTIEMK